MGWKYMEQPAVLVVDDVIAIVEELLTLMQLHGILARGESNLDDALAVLEREPAIRVICCDVRLDRESGLEVVGRIRDHAELCKRAFRYIFVTGDQTQIDRLNLTSGTTVLSKPVQPALLMDTIKRMLASTNG
jgi:CheY-like chemotaxis protein